VRPLRDAMSDVREFFERTARPEPQPRRRPVDHFAGG
jgi:hypothetical protein